MIELDRHIEILLLSNDCVIIPNFGGFMAHYEEARKDERDNAFLPPMRAVGFNPKLVLNDSLLAQSYVEVYDISYPDAVARIEDEVRELKQHLANDGEYEMRHIGVLKLNADGGYDFEPCSAGILTPELYGLGYVEFKTLAQLDAETVEDSETAHIINIAEPQQEEETAQVADIDEAREHTVSVGLWRNVAVACVAFIVFLLIPAPLANNNPQLMQGKINTRLLEHVMPKSVTTGEEQVEELVKASLRASAKKAAAAVSAQAEVQKPQGYAIVLASRVTRRNAEAYVATLHKRGYDEARVLSANKKTKVVYGQYATRDDAYKALGKLNDRAEFAEAWVMKYE